MKKEIDGRRVEIIDVSPAIAEGWLKKNTKNRPLKPGVVDGYANTMKMGKWTLTTEPIAFSRPFTDPVSLERKPETLIDGQHRLAAVIASGVTVQMTVWFGCEPEEFNVVGQGRRRTNGDVLFLTQVGLRDPYVIASAVSSFARHSLGYNRGVEPWVTQIVLTAFPTDFTAASKYKGKMGKLITRPVMAALILARLVAATKTDELVDQLHSGIGFNEKDAGRLLFRYLHDQRLRAEGQDSAETIYYKVCNALAYRLEGRKCDALLGSPSGVNYLRNAARKKLEPVLRALYADDAPSNFWEPKISTNRGRLLKAKRKTPAANE